MHATHRLLGPAVFGFLLLLSWSQISFVNTGAIPLALKSPYLSIWTHGPYIGDTSDNALTLDEYSLILLVRLNNKTYTIGPNSDTSLQTGIKVTPTQSIFNFAVGPVNITYNFFTPIEFRDLRRLSLPVSYVAVSARSTDKLVHPVQIFVGWQGRTSTGDSDAIIRWNSQQLGPLFDLNMERVSQTSLYEYQNRAHWGTFHVFTNSSGTTFGIDNIDHLKKNFTSEGQLYNNMDQNFRPYDDNNPAMGFTKDIIAGPSPSPNVFFGMARVVRPAINTTEGPMNHLWEDFFNGDEKEMIKFAFTDAERALDRSSAFGYKIEDLGRKYGNQNYSDLFCYASRQAFYGMDLVGTQNRTWAFIKDIGETAKDVGSCQRVDLLYANMPVHLYLNPRILKYLLEPLLVYQESGLFTKQWAVSDLGAAYPQCTGGHDLVMGVEQSANMIIIIDAYVRASKDTDFARQHYNVSRKWAEYLVTNGLYPGEAFTSYDYLEKTVNSTNLSLKAIVGIAAMADIAKRVNNTADHSHYRSIAEDYAAQWIQLSLDPKRKHIKFSYNDETSDSWVLLYNLYADILLETNLIPRTVIEQQQLWYLSHLQTYGVPLRNGINTSRVNWLLFTAAASPDKVLRETIYDRLAPLWSKEFQYTPFGDRFKTSSSGYPDIFFDRLTVGAVFAPLTTLARSENLFSVDG